MKKLSSLFFLFLLFHIGNAHAGSLTIGGRGELRLRGGGDHMELVGSYVIFNSGDETAKNVFPSFLVGAWSWSGEPKEIVAGGRASWEIRGSLSSRFLECSDKLHCPSALPLRGLVPILVRRYYQDINGAGFSASEVMKVVVGEVSQDDLAGLRQVNLSGQLECSGPGQSFVCKLKIFNSDTARHDVLATWYTSNELHVLTSPEVLNIDGNTESHLRSEIENMSGLSGSSYAFNAILQWNQGGLRNTDVAITHVVIAPSRSVAPLYFALVGSLLVVFGMAMYWTVFRKTT